MRLPGQVHYKNKPPRHIIQFSQSKVKKVPHWWEKSGCQTLTYSSNKYSRRKLAPNSRNEIVCLKLLISYPNSAKQWFKLIWKKNKNNDSKRGTQVGLCARALNATMAAFFCDCTYRCPEHDVNHCQTL